MGLLTGRAGLFALLNEDSRYELCLAPSTSAIVTAVLRCRLRRRRSQEFESAFSARVNTELQHACFKPCRAPEAAFVIHHYAGPVKYGSQRMSFKNKDAPVDGK